MHTSRKSSVGNDDGCKGALIKYGHAENASVIREKKCIKHERLPSHFSQSGRSVEVRDKRGSPEQDNTRKTLRFKPHDRVECLYNDGDLDEAIMYPGEVVKLWYREVEWPTDICAPYQVRLDNMCLVYAPLDIDDIVRAERSDSTSFRRKHLRPWYVCL